MPSNSSRMPGSKRAKPPGASNMRRLGDSVQKILVSMGGDPGQARKAARGAQVRSMWRNLMTHNHDAFILEHTNNVYIVHADGKPHPEGKRFHGDGKDASSTGRGKQLIVYVDDSVVAAELNARRELIKLQFLEHYHEDIDEFKILISRGRYKKIHPFVEEKGPSYHEGAQPAPLTEEQRALISQQTAKTDNPKVARALERAMEKDLEWKDGAAQRPERHR